MDRILVVEDDTALNEGIVYALKTEQEKYEVQSARSLEEARRFLSPSPDLVLLDVNLPDGDGRELLKDIRKSGGGSVPVILLTALDTENDMVLGFDAGCDDYITKPFSMPVLLRRVRAVLRRAGETAAGGKYRNGALTYDFTKKELYKNGEAVSMTATELRLLEYFLQNRNQALTRGQILEAVWDAYENYVDEGALNVNILRLREKIEEDAKHPVYIRTLFGIGYQWKDGG